LIQLEYDLGWVDRVVVLNRQDGNQARITCYQLELLDAFEYPFYSYPFTSTASSYTFRDPLTDPVVAASCNYMPPPPPMAPRPSTPVCGGAAGEFIRYVRIKWNGTCSAPSNGWLNVAELQLWYNGQNVAAGKGGSQSNTWQNSAAYTADKLTDGKSYTMFHSGLAGTGTYVTIDLGVCGCLSCCVCFWLASSLACLPACLPARLPARLPACLPDCLTA
jgi:hypothetical protein